MRIRRFAKVLAAFLVGVMLVHPLFPNRENRACATLHNAGFFYWGLRLFPDRNVRIQV